MPGTKPGKTTVLSLNAIGLDLANASRHNVVTGTSATAVG
jgi:hypothetical protein